MPYIIEIALFVSRLSKASIDVVQALSACKLPVAIVRLDTAEERLVARESKRITITRVPTLVVVSDNGKLSLFEGREKCIRCIEQLCKKPTPSPTPQSLLPQSSHPSLPQSSLPFAPMKKRKVRKPKQGAEIEFMNQLDPAQIAEQGATVFEKAAQMSAAREHDINQ